MSYKPMVKMCPDCGQSWSRSPVEAEKKIKDQFCTHHGKKLIAMPKCSDCGVYFNPFKSDFCFGCGKLGEEVLPKKYAKIVENRKKEEIDWAFRKKARAKLQKKFSKLNDKLQDSKTLKESNKYLDKMRALQKEMDAL